VNYGLLTTSRGCPVAVSVYDGNTNDAKTLIPQVQKLRGDFGIKNLVIAGDRGMISQKAIDDRTESSVARSTCSKHSRRRPRPIREGCLPLEVSLPGT
jgi:hypothetical protein